MKHIIYLLLPFFLFSHANAAIYCAKELQKNLNFIEKIPEGKVLLDTISKEGDIKIIAQSTQLSKQFGAYWDPDTRVICIHLSPECSQGNLVGSLLFELNNALVTKKIDLLDGMASRRTITRDQYIESMEYMEYINSLNAAKIAEKGIALGILPGDARLPTYSSFKEHFAMQKKSGHSAHFGRNYDRLVYR